MASKKKGEGAARWIVRRKTLRGLLRAQLNGYRKSQRMKEFKENKHFECNIVRTLKACKASKHEFCEAWVTVQDEVSPATILRWIESSGIRNWPPGAVMKLNFIRMIINWYRGRKPKTMLTKKDQLCQQESANANVGTGNVLSQDIPSAIYRYMPIVLTLMKHGLTTSTNVRTLLSPNLMQEVMQCEARAMVNCKFTTLHYIQTSLHLTTYFTTYILHYNFTTSNFTTYFTTYILHYILHYIQLHYIQLHYTSLHFTTYTSLHASL